MLTYQELKKGAIESLEWRFLELVAIDEDKVTEIISEVTEDWIPVYYYEILRVWLSNLDLVCTKSELGPVNWEDFPMNRLISNIYDFLSSDLYEWYDSEKK